MASASRARQITVDMLPNAKANREIEDLDEPMYDLSTHALMTGVCASTWMCNAHAGSQTPPSLQKPKVTKVESSCCLLTTNNHAPTTPSQFRPISQAPIHCLRSPVYRPRGRSYLPRPARSTPRRPRVHLHRLNSRSKVTGTASTPGSSCSIQPTGLLSHRATLLAQ